MLNQGELATEATGPLKGVKILDLTSVVFGAYATQMLGDLGAEVIKVESPASGRGEGGDIMRWAGNTPEGAPQDLGPIFMTINRNKRSMLLDLTSEPAKAALKLLIEWADVFACSVRYDGMKRLGLGYEDVKAIKPDIIYVHGAGYGSDGPYAGEPAYDDLIQSASGLADLLPRTDGNPIPRLIPSLVADKVSGLFMTQAILAALYHREKTGEGQFVEVPMFECLTSFNLAEHMFGHVFDPPTGQWAYSRVANPPPQAIRHRGRLYRPPPVQRQAVVGLLRGGGLRPPHAGRPLCNPEGALGKLSRPLWPDRGHHPHQDHHRVAGPAEAPAHPGDQDQPAGRPDGRSAPEGRGLLRALRAP